MNQASAPWPSHIHGCCSEHVVRERKVLRALFLIAFLSSVFWYCTIFCLSSADFRRRRGEKWNSLMFLHSPALLLTADVEDGRLEIGFNISWGLFIPLLLISQKVRFLAPLEGKNFWKIFWTYPQGSAQLHPGRANTRKVPLFILVAPWVSGNPAKDFQGQTNWPLACP